MFSYDAASSISGRDHAIKAIDHNLRTVACEHSSTLPGHIHVLPQLQPTDNLRPRRNFLALELPQGDILAALHAVEADQVRRRVGSRSRGGEIITPPDDGQHPPTSRDDLIAIIPCGAGVKDKHLIQLRRVAQAMDHLAGVIGTWIPARRQHNPDRGARSAHRLDLVPVSYTHLTLP